jgi:MFS family permease
LVVILRSRLLPYFVLVAVTTMSLGAVFTMLAEFRDRLGISESGLGVMVAMGFFSAFFSQIGLSRFADRGHSKVMIRMGLVTLVSAHLVMAVATELWQLIGSRVLLGLGVGLIIPAVRRVVILSDPANVGANVGLLGSFDVSGFVAGPLVAAVMVELTGFRSPFLALAALTAAIIPFVTRLPADSGAVSTERNVMRALLSRRAIQATLMVAIGWFAMLGAFESVWAVMLTDRGAETWMIGLTLSIIVAPMVVLAPRGGQIAQRHGPIRVAAFGVLAVIPCVAFYGFIDSLFLLAVVAVLQGIGDSVTFPATQVAAAMAAPDDQLASAQGLLGATLELVAGVAALAAGVMYDNWGAPAVFGGSAVVMALGVVGAAVLAAPLAAAGDPVWRVNTSRARADRLSSGR